MKATYSLIFIILLLISCKPQQIITEKTITNVDSTAIWSLKNELYSKEIRIGVLESELKRSMEENVVLRNETSSHAINYDTAAQIDPQTGKYPIANETITETKSSLEKTVKEYETQITEYKKEVYNLNTYNANLELEVNTLLEENKDLKIKTTPTTGFNFRLFIVGVVIGLLFPFLIKLLFFKFSK